MRRRPIQYAPFTSLLDVLFILVFASLIHGASLENQAVKAAVAEVPDAGVAAAPDAGVAAAPDAGVAAAPDPEAEAARDADELRRAAMAQVIVGLEGRSPVVARIGGDGELRALERMREGRLASKPLGLPLVERVPDPDVALVYLGDRKDGPTLCNLLRLHLGARDLSDALVIVAPDVPLEQLSVALARGLQRDAERCLADQRGVAVIVDPRAARGARQQGGVR